MIVDQPDGVPAILRLLDQAWENHVVLDTETTGLDTFGLTDRREGSKRQGPLILDEVEKHGPARMCGLSIGIPMDPQELQTFYLPFRHETAEPQLPIGLAEVVIRHIEDRGMTIVGHHLKFDLKVFQADHMMPDDRKVKIEDTMILEHVLNAESDSFALANMAARYTGHDVSWKNWTKDEYRSRKLRRYSQFDVAELGPYAEDDAFMTWILRQHLYPKLSDTNPPWYGGDDLSGRSLESVFLEDMKLLWALLRMETHGIKIDKQKTEDIIAALMKQQILLQDQLNEIAHTEINVQSSKAMKELFVQKAWPIPKDPFTGNATFADLVLSKMPYSGPDVQFKEFVDLAQQLRSVNKMRGTYFESYLRLMDPTGLVHPDFWEHGTATGRLSCHSPNFQNVPRRFSLSTLRGLSRTEEELVQAEVRTVFIPRSKDYRFVGCDYSQQEMRMFLHYAEEPSMREVIVSGGDVHHFAAETLFGEPMPAKFDEHGKETAEYKRRRALAKIINFGILYGMGPKKLATQMEISPERAKQFYDNYMAGFPGIRKFMQRVSDVADSRLFISSAYGRRFRFHLITDEDRARGWIQASGKGRIYLRPGMRAVTHKALNYLIQGSCADLSRRSMVRIDELLRSRKTMMVNQVHDELLFEVHNDEREEVLPMIRAAMSDWPQFKLPFTSTDKQSDWSWAEAKEL